MVVCARMPGKITLLVDSRINKFVPFVKRAACPFDAYNDVTTRIVMEKKTARQKCGTRNYYITREKLVKKKKKIRLSVKIDKKKFLQTEKKYTD